MTSPVSSRKSTPHSPAISPERPAKRQRYLSRKTTPASPPALQADQIDVAYLNPLSFVLFEQRLASTPQHLVSAWDAGGARLALLLRNHRRA